MARLTTVEGIGETYEAKLKEVGINSIEAYLEECTTKKGRTNLAEKSGISEKLILKWANHADLMRIKGIGGEYSELLEAAGVDTVPELSKRKPENLYNKMLEVNAEKKLVRKPPALTQVEKWVEEAGTLPRKLSY
jgi:predicted flap endonuclease-1-like 5' DNA nuclease